MASGQASKASCKAGKPTCKASTGSKVMDMASGKVGKESGSNIPVARLQRTGDWHHCRQFMCAQGRHAGQQRSSPSAHPAISSRACNSH
jgi:hypothetical protein